MREEIWIDGILYTREIQLIQDDFVDYIALWHDYNPSLEMQQIIVV